MISKQEAAPPSIDELQMMALEGNWGEIDPILPDLADMPEYRQWAEEGLLTPQENTRDLAASILQLSRVELSDNETLILETLMLADEGQFVRIRCAFALFAHGDRDSTVIETIEEALVEPDVAEIARYYLEILEGEL